MKLNKKAMLNADCSDCKDIYTKSQYLICNVQVTKGEYEVKMKELKEN